MDRALVALILIVYKMLLITGRAHIFQKFFAAVLRRAHLDKPAKQALTESLAHALAMLLTATKTSKTA